jgi:hypothetical protein
VPLGQTHDVVVVGTFVQDVESGLMTLVVARRQRYEQDAQREDDG